MAPSESEFLTSVLTAGAIISGFCGSFLVFRVQREAEYHRAPGKYWGEQHFTSSLLLLCIATFGAFTFGVVLPLLALAKSCSPSWLQRAVVMGLIFSIVTLGSYIVDELVHYRILFPLCEVRQKTEPIWLKRIVKLDWCGFRRERPIWIGGMIVAVIAAITLWFVWPAGSK